METAFNNAAGYNIIEISEDLWLFQQIGGQFVYGTFREILLVAILHYSFKVTELEAAIQRMVEENHNAAHFGMWGSFIYSFNHRFSSERKAS